MRARLLEPSEYHKIEQTNIPQLTPYVRPEDYRVLVLEDQGEIVASMMVLRATLWEGAWIAPKHRGNAGVMRRLLRSAAEIAEKWSDWVFAGAADSHVLGLLGRIGAQELPITWSVVRLRGEKCRFLS